MLKPMTEIVVYLQFRKGHNFLLDYKEKKRLADWRRSLNLKGSYLFHYFFYRLACFILICINTFVNTLTLQKMRKKGKIELESDGWILFIRRMAMHKLIARIILSKR
ncbi:hypothetical protein AN619_04220 [Thermotalea metallivorans]|uniref:Uncharacterized protein n=1 Tax=Thermotalea metallivorans TaxID=520762 RepID=A0A140LAJ4_9FIRM|nr:hypothetical protein AN619_04220 [Thermotalea metallivorans]